MAQLALRRFAYFLVSSLFSSVSQKSRSYLFVSLLYLSIILWMTIWVSTYVWYRLGLWRECGELYSLLSKHLLNVHCKSHPLPSALGPVTSLMDIPRRTGDKHRPRRKEQRWACWKTAISPWGRLRRGEAIVLDWRPGTAPPSWWWSSWGWDMRRHQPAAWEECSQQGQQSKCP